MILEARKERISNIIEKGEEKQRPYEREVESIINFWNRPLT